ncbi:MAG: WYL domain-containing transcriptional regulator [Methylococcaceae bacterium]|nr:MAG: WYL domain-containing transcriptional regulator [Methylococcaceae bacterium]
MEKMKAGSRPQYYRIRRMVQMVQEGSGGGEPPNSTDFMAEFGVSRRTVARDLDFLRDEARDDARHGFRLTDETYTLPPVRISRREAVSVARARTLLAHDEGTPLHRDMRSVLEKIAESLVGDITLEPDWLSEHVGVLPEDRVRIDPEVWAQLAGFVERREAVRAEYQTFTGRVSEYELHPCHLLAYHGNWYVLAWNVAKDHIETFALSRFRRIEATGQTFTRPADFNPETYARQAFGIVGGEEPIKVRLLFEATLGRLHHGAPVAPQPGVPNAIRWLCRDASGDNRTQGACAVGPVLDARREGAGAQEPAGPNRGEASEWTTGTGIRQDGPTTR